MANNEGEKLFLEQKVVELEAKVGELKELLELKAKDLEREVQERDEQLCSVEGDNQYLQQQITQLQTKVSKLDEKK